MSAGLLDTSVVLCVLKREKGFPQAAKLLPVCPVSVVNLAEVMTKLNEWGRTRQQIDVELRQLTLQIEGFTEDDALETGALRPLTRAQGLSLGDRACLATAKRLGVPAYSCDQAWAKLDSKAIGVDVRVIR